MHYLASYILNRNALPNMKSHLQPSSDQFKATNRMVQLGYSSFNVKNSIPYYDQDICQSITNSRKWTIKNYYKPYGWSEVFSDMQETNAQEIQAQQSSSNILSDICHIKFHQLRSIDLNSNYITSIEPMVHMYLPNVDSINLANNFITSINSLVKMDLRSVNNLDLTKNMIQEVSRLHLVNAKIINVKITVHFGLVISKLTGKLI